MGRGWGPPRSPGQPRGSARPAPLRSSEDERAREEGKGRPGRRVRGDQARDHLTDPEGLLPVPGDSEPEHSVVGYWLPSGDLTLREAHRGIVEMCPSAGAAKASVRPWLCTAQLSCVQQVPVRRACNPKGICSVSIATEQ